MSSKREQVLNALFTRLSALTETEVKRNGTLPLKIPDGGLVVLRDGNIGEPTILLSPPYFLYQHRVEIEVVIQQISAADNDERLDRILEKIGRLLMIDVTLSGFIEQPVDGGLTIKGAIIPIVLEYVSNSNLT